MAPGKGKRKSAKAGGKRKSSKGRRVGRKKKKESKSVFVELDVENDVPPLKCTCPSNIRRKDYKTHLCPIERKVKYSLYDDLHGTPVPAVGFTKKQVLRRVESTCLPSKEEFVSVPQTVITKSDCEAKLKKYEALLARYEDRDVEDLAPVYTRIATLQIALARYPDALENSRLACKVDPYYAAGFFQLGMSNYYSNQFEEAAKVFLRGLKYSPRNPRLEKALSQTMRFVSEQKSN